MPLGLCCTTSLFFPSRFDSNQLSSGAFPRSDVKVPDVGFGFNSRICPRCFHAFYGSLIDVDYCHVSSWPALKFVPPSMFRPSGRAVDSKRRILGGGNIVDSCALVSVAFFQSLDGLWIGDIS